MIRAAFGLVACLLAGSVVAQDATPACRVADATPLIKLDGRLDIEFPGDLKFACAGPARKLWLDGMDTGIGPVGCIESGKRLVFHLTQAPAASRAEVANTWMMLLRNPFSNTDKQYQRQTAVTVKDGAGANPVSCGNAPLQVASTELFAVGFLLVVAVLGGILILGANSDLLRDAGPLPSGRRPYSLARVQMAWWFCIVFACYLLLWLLTHELPNLPKSVLWLIGIAGASGVAASAIDRNKNEAVQPSAGFFRDVLTNSSGVALHRFQMFAWTAAFGVVFVTQTISRLAMPDFDNSVLVLMGISAGSYLGFKVPETHVDEPVRSAAPAYAGAAGTASDGSVG